MTLLILAVTAGGLSWLMWREKRQQRRNRALIAAILHADTPAALVLLDAGADPNTHLDPDPPRSAWQLLLDRIRGRRPPPNTSDTALLLVMDCLPERDRRGSDEFGAPLEKVVLVRALLDNGADVNAESEDGETPLLQATHWRYFATTMVLLAHQADVNAADDKGTAALMNAAIWGRTEIAASLLDRGANPDAQDIYGDTALTLASFIEQQEGVVRALLAHHANVHLKNLKGQTALDIARHMKEAGIIRMLREAGAR
jgi:hypothetical protein